MIKMNDIITDFIGKQIAKRISVNQPIDSSINPTEYNNHIKNCKKQICTECSKILKGDNN